MKFIPTALAMAIASLGQDATAFVHSTGATASVSNNNIFLQPTPSSIIPQYNDQPQPHRRHNGSKKPFQLFMSSTATDEDLQAEIKSMRVAAIKSELESYGISTRTFLEKSELVEALVQARKEGKTPMASSSSSSTTTTTASTSGGASTSSTSTTTTTTNNASSSTSSTTDRQARLTTEMENCKSMKVSDLKAELESYGISTKSFFEKSEFVKSVAEARVDGVTAKQTTTATSGGGKKKKRRSAATEEDEVEEVTAKVEVITNDSVGPKTKKTRDAADAAQQTSGNPFGGGNPFGSAAGGGASPFGGAGGMDMGNIADMLKGMGGMGGGGGGGAGGSPFGPAAGGGANPFGGAAGGGSPFGGANPFGGGGGGMDDPMKAAQQAMSNPKVMAVIQKAQKNPKVMQAVQECMGNPMAMAKYMSDPEVGPILKELQEAMM